MSDWVFVDIPAGAVEGLAEPEFPFPLRRDQMAVFERHRDDEFPLFLVVDELDLYLDEFPKRIERYRRPGTHLAMCAGIDACMEGCTEHSLDYYRLAVWLDPANHNARMNYAVALHSLGRREEAIQQYGEIIARAGIVEWWRAWMLSAEALMGLGRDQEAMALLNEAKQVIPDDNQFWSTLALCESRCQPRCPHCGEELKGTARFCGQCGGKLA